MRRDTRLNLLFLAAFLALSLPGAVILFRKKLNPNAARLFLPDAIQHRVAYMAPIPDVSETRRVVPPVTHRWIASLIEQRAPNAVPILPVGREGSFSPAISQDKFVEVVATRRETSLTKLFVILWNVGKMDGAAAGKWQLNTFDNQSTASALEEKSVISVPKEVRDELRQFEFAGPPESVGWLMISVPTRLSDGESSALKLTPGLGREAVTTVNFFTTSDRTK